MTIRKPFSLLYFSSPGTLWCKRAPKFLLDTKSSLKLKYLMASDSLTYKNASEVQARENGNFHGGTVKLSFTASLFLLYHFLLFLDDFVRKMVLNPSGNAHNPTAFTPEASDTGKPTPAQQLPIPGPSTLGSALWSAYASSPRQCPDIGCVIPTSRRGNHEKP